MSAVNPGSGVAHSTWTSLGANDTDAVPPIRSNVMVWVGTAVAVGDGCGVGSGGLGVALGDGCVAVGVSVGCCWAVGASVGRGVGVLAACGGVVGRGVGGELAALGSLSGSVESVVGSVSGVASSSADRSRFNSISGSSAVVGSAVAVGALVALGAGSMGMTAVLERDVEMAGPGLITWLSTMLTPCHAMVVAAKAAHAQRMTKARARIIK